MMVLDLPHAALASGVTSKNAFQDPQTTRNAHRSSVAKPLGLRISILVTAYRRPHQLREALASLASQDRSLIGEIIVGDDSPAAETAANRAEIASSELAPLVKYFAHTPALGAYPNHWFLGDQASFSHLLFLHDDDALVPGALRLLANACINETDERVRLWFGRNLIMNCDSTIDVEESRENASRYGKDGASGANAMWHWCLTESVPPNSFLVVAEDYKRLMRDPHDGNVGDWGFNVRFANTGAWARFLAQDISCYRVQPGSSTNAGAGVDVHRWFAISQQLRVPPQAEPLKLKHFSPSAQVAVVRFVRDGERSQAWRCYASPNWTWRQRLSVRGLAVLGMLIAPRALWSWALHHKA